MTHSIPARQQERASIARSAARSIDLPRSASSSADKRTVRCASRMYRRMGSLCRDLRLSRKPNASSTASASMADSLGSTYVSKSSKGERNSKRSSVSAPMSPRTKPTSASVSGSRAPFASRQTSSTACSGTLPSRLARNRSARISLRPAESCARSNGAACAGKSASK